jgi:hypothetical protein
MSAAHKALIRRLYEEVFHQGKLALIDELFSHCCKDLSGE